MEDQPDREFIVKFITEEDKGYKFYVGELVDNGSSEVSSAIKEKGEQVDGVFLLP